MIHDHNHAWFVTNLRFQPFLTFRFSIRKPPKGAASDKDPKQGKFHIGLILSDANFFLACSPYQSHRIFLGTWLPRACLPSAPTKVGASALPIFGHCGGGRCANGCTTLATYTVVKICVL